jgi:hypothetical protein
MAWNKTLTYNHDSETKRELHVLNAYADPDFIEDVERVAGKDGAKLFADFFGNHTDSNSADKSTPHSIEDIAQKYLLTLDEVMHFIIGARGIMSLPRNLPFRINWDEYDAKDYFTVTLSSDIKKKDLIAIWTLLSNKQKAKRVGKATKNKALEDDRLVYAIFKQLQKTPPPKFREILDLYKECKLPLYDKRPSKRYDDVQKLENYYNKHKPLPPIKAESAVAQRFDELRLEEIKQRQKDQN